MNVPMEPVKEKDKTSEGIIFLKEGTLQWRRKPSKLKMTKSI